MSNTRDYLFILICCVMIIGAVIAIVISFMPIDEKAVCSNIMNTTLRKVRFYCVCGDLPHNESLWPWVEK